jgi:hypothetical protein
MKKLSAFLLLVFVSCSSDDNTNPLPFEPVNVEFSLIGKLNENTPFEGIDQGNFVITNQNDWIDFKNLIDARYIELGMGNFHTENFFIETEVDFNNYNVIAVFDEVYSNGGHSIDITNIIENENSIIVTIEKLLNGNLTSIVTQPYHIVKIPITTKPITFE